MTRLKVGVRLRPLSSRELENDGLVVVSVENHDTVTVTNVKVPEQNAGDSRERTRRFTFDFCLDQNSTQEDAYRAVEQIVGRAVKKRCNSCVLAYGQSSTGKTHTMFGFGQEQGIVPNLCRNIFGYLRETAVGEECSNIRPFVSYLEIYNEKVRDLLCDKQTTLKVRQHPKKGPYVQGLSEHIAENSGDLLDLLEKGTNSRHVGSTVSNPRSSRSHSVFVIQFDGVKLTLVDLAGSERAGNRCYGSSTFKEGANINKSLVALGNVISALAEDNRNRGRKFVPYRDSVLTWLLKDTLGGNSETLMIATISPSSTCYSETVNTLRFGQRAKLIVSIPVVKENPTEKIIRELRAEIARLKELLLENNNSMDPKSNKILNTPHLQSPQESQEPPLKSTETLIPFVKVAPKPEPTKLRRTFSVEHPPKKMEASGDKKFGSEETIAKKTSRKSSIEKSASKVLTKRQTELKMTEKSVATDYKARVESKVDSIRKPPLKPRSQIVAAVTNRLYSKTKKKEVATDTSDINIEEPPKELSICSNARLKLKELTRKALKAHRSRNEETQTDLFPILRVKEISTDVDDLKMLLVEVKNAETCTQMETKDKETSCDWLCSFNAKPASLTLTKSCGTQFQNSVSFTKYLQDLAKPSYASVVNINVSTVSDDSLDDVENVCFPTPDLISNHNSLEPSHAITEYKIKHGTDSLGEELVLHQTKDLYVENFAKDMGISKIVPRTGDFCNVSFAQTYATEICLKDARQSCEHFCTPPPQQAKANLVETKCCYLDDSVKINEPTVLKSIMKFNICEPEESDEEPKEELPDSLEYHAANHKKVHFTKKRKKTSNDRLMVAISNFMDEATKLLNSLSSIKCDVHVTVEEEPKLPGMQPTEPNWDFLHNKYEHVLEESCRRLEEKIRGIGVRKEEECNNHWEAGTEDFSLPTTFSDYGSLPRRKYRSACSPSAYLRQLTNMRRHVIESSRENLYNL